MCRLAVLKEREWAKDNQLKTEIKQVWSRWCRDFTARWGRWGQEFFERHDAHARGIHARVQWVPIGSGPLARSAFRSSSNKGGFLSMITREDPSLFTQRLCCHRVCSAKRFLRSDTLDSTPGHQAEHAFILTSRSCVVLPYRRKLRDWFLPKGSASVPVGPKQIHCNGTIRCPCQPPASQKAAFSTSAFEFWKRQQRGGAGSM